MTPKCHGCAKVMRENTFKGERTGGFGYRNEGLFCTLHCAYTFAVTRDYVPTTSSDPCHTKSLARALTRHVEHVIRSRMPGVRA